MANRPLENGIAFAGGMLICALVLGIVVFKITPQDEVKTINEPILVDTLVKRCDSCNYQMRIPLNNYVISKYVNQ